MYVLTSVHCKLGTLRVLNFYEKNICIVKFFCRTDTRLELIYAGIILGIIGLLQQKELCRNNAEIIEISVMTLKMRVLIRTLGKKLALKTKREEIMHVLHAVQNTQAAGLHTESVAKSFLQMKQWA